MNKVGFVYIMTNVNNTVLYTGVTSKLYIRIFEHKTMAHPQSFTSKYRCVKLVYYNTFPNIEAAIAEEKRIKAGSREKKEDLINAVNPAWNDLWDSVTHL